MGLLDLFRRKSPPPTRSPRELFTEELRQRVLQLPHVTSAEPLTDSFGLAVEAGGQQLQLFLDNVFAETRDVDPEERERILSLFLGSIVTAPKEPEPWESAAPKLRLVLRPAYSAAFDLKQKPLVTEEVAPGVRAHLVLDEETSMRFVLEEDLQRWGVDPAAAWARGRENMKPLAEDRLVLYDERPAQLWHLETGDDYEAARVLAPGFLASLRALVEGDPVVIFPSRSLLFVGGDADPAAVSRLVELARREYFAQPREISCALYTVDAQDRLIPYLPEGDGEPARQARAAHLNFLGSEYTRQQQELEKLYEEEGTDLFVAGFRVMEQGARRFSFCVWSIGVEGLLPRTDYLVVRGTDPEDKHIHFVPWEAASRIAGGLLTVEPRLFPTRWRTAKEVPAEVHAALLTAAEPLPQKA